jgi:hypothetical protein
VGGDPGVVRDKFSAAYLVSAAARAIRDVSILRSRADKAGKKLATLTLETEVRFHDAKARQEFAEELVNTIARLAMKYHQEDAKDGRSFRFLVGAYPTITKQEPADQPSVRME